MGHLLVGGKWVGWKVGDFRLWRVFTGCVEALPLDTKRCWRGNVEGSRALGSLSVRLVDLLGSHDGSCDSALAGTALIPARDNSNRTAPMSHPLVRVPPDTDYVAEVVVLLTTLGAKRTEYSAGKYARDLLEIKRVHHKI
eukprot:2878891-Amphidinium_carterae.1